ncbi:MAG TPA: CinA family protein [Acidimicrobiia bacterium]|nr:CinA family protein [Acidimicrobiia bacterium]
MAQPEHPDVTAIAHRLAADGAWLAVAESLTGGELSSLFATAGGSSDWYRGAVVAYSSDVKRSLLDVPEGPVVSAQAVTAMAENVADLFEAEVGLAVSGVAGPAAQDDQPPGTVWLAIHIDGRTHTRIEHFEGEPPEVVDATLRCAPAWLLELLNQRT